MNQHIIIGRMGKDPEIRNLDSGKSVANFSVATSMKWKDKSGNVQEKTQWHNIVLWGQPADFAAKYIHKGDLVMVLGRVETRDWEKEGVKHYMTETIGERIEIMNNGRSDKQEGNSQVSAQKSFKTNAKPSAKKQEPAKDVDEDPDWMRDDAGGASDDLPF